MTDETEVLFVVDVLPAYCGVEGEVNWADGGREARFRARNAEGRMTAWSGWFRYEGEPIQLTWAAFEWEV